jgi:hypothetical protein
VQGTRNRVGKVLEVRITERVQPCNVVGTWFSPANLSGRLIDLIRTLFLTTRQLDTNLTELRSLSPSDKYTEIAKGESAKVVGHDLQCKVHNDCFKFAVMIAGRTGDQANTAPGGN